MSIKYKLNQRGTQSLAESADIQSGMVQAADMVKRAAESIPPPKLRPAKVRQAYSSSFKVVPNKAKVRGGRGMGAKPRAAAMVINDHELEHVLGGRGRILYRAMDSLKGVKIG